MLAKSLCQRVWINQGGMCLPFQRLSRAMASLSDLTLFLGSAVARRLDTSLLTRHADIAEKYPFDTGLPSEHECLSAIGTAASGE